MVYKIKIDIDYLDSALISLKDLGDFVLKQDCVFLSTDKDIPDRIFFKEVLEVTPDNYKIYTGFSDTTKTWCLDKLKQKELEDYENSDECQKRLKLLNEYMDKLEKGMGVIKNGKTETDTKK